MRDRVDAHCRSMLVTLFCSILSSCSISYNLHFLPFCISWTETRHEWSLRQRREPIHGGANKRNGHPSTGTIPNTPSGSSEGISLNVFSSALAPSLTMRHNHQHVFSLVFDMYNKRLVSYWANLESLNPVGRKRYQFLCT